VNIILAHGYGGSEFVSRISRKVDYIVLHSQCGGVCETVERCRVN